MADPSPQFLTVGTGVAERRIAYIAEPGDDRAGPGLVWLPGLKSDMTSTKASALAQWAARGRLAYTRFDYSGHGQSGGRFEDGTIGRWLEEALAVFSHLTRGPQILVGSSMGGYIALLLLRSLMREQPSESSHIVPSPVVPKARVPRDVGEGQGGGDGRAADAGIPPTPSPSPRGGGGFKRFHAERIRALVLIAPAWDMTERLMWARFPEPVRREILDNGVHLRPSKYEDGPYAITRGLIEEGRSHLIGDVPFDPGRPIHILHGLQDPDVPWEHTLDLVAHLSGNWTHVSAVPDGDHRLSRPQDLELLISVLGTLARPQAPR